MRFAEAYPVLARARRNLARGFGLALVLGAVAPCVNAQVSIQYNQTINGFLPAGLDAPLFDPVPGQTVTHLAASEGANDTLVNGQSVTACGIFPSGGCSQGPGAATLNSSFPAQYGLTESFFAQGGNNADTALLGVGGTPAAVPSSQLIMVSEAIDLQQLQINYGGTLPPPTTVGIDINYSLGAAVADESIATPYSYIASADAGVAVLDPATYNPTGGSNAFSASIQQLFDVNASAANLGASTSAATTSSNLLALAPNKPYWVDVGTFDAFIGGIVLPDSTLEGESIDVGMAAIADPTFTIDPTWLSENPQYAGDISISQQFNSGTPVPEPATWLLLFAALPGLLCAVRRNSGPRSSKCHRPETFRV